MNAFSKLWVASCPSDMLVSEDTCTSAVFADYTAKCKDSTPQCHESTQVRHVATNCLSGSAEKRHPPTSGQRQPQTSCARLQQSTGTHKYSTCTGYVLSCIIYVNILQVGGLCCSENSKPSSEGHWNSTPHRHMP